MNAGLAAKPGHLPFAVAARLELSGPDGVRFAHPVLNHEQRLAVAEGVERFRRGWDARFEELADLIEQTLMEHRSGSCIQTLVESLARRIKADFERLEAFERRAAGGEQF